MPGGARRRQVMAGEVWPPGGTVEASVPLAEDIYVSGAILGAQHG